MTRFRMINSQLDYIEGLLQKPFLIERKLKDSFAELEKVKLELISQIADEPPAIQVNELHAPFLLDEKAQVYTPNQLLARTENFIARIAHILIHIDPHFKQKPQTPAVGDAKLEPSKQPVGLRPFRATDLAITKFFYKPMDSKNKVMSTHQSDTANSGDDLLLEIMEYLPVRSRVSTMTVSKSWNNAVRQSIVHERYVPIKTVNRLGMILANNSVLFSKFDSKQSHTMINFRLQIKQHFLPELKSVQVQIYDLNNAQADNDVIGCDCIMENSDKKRNVMGICGCCCCLICVGGATTMVIGGIKAAIGNQKGDQEDEQIGSDMFAAGFFTDLIVVLLIILIALIQWIRRRQLDNRTDNEFHQIEQGLKL